MAGHLLARYPLLRLLSEQQMHDWLAAGQEATFATGEIVFQENTPGAWVYLVQSGRVRILRQVGEREVTLGTLLAGDIFGEYALLPPGRNTATCRTAAPSRLLCLPLEPLRLAIQEMKPVWKNLKNWLRLHVLLQFYQQRAFLGFIAADSGLKLLDRLQRVTFPTGQTIQARALAPDCWYVIEAGRVQLVASDSNAEKTVELGPGAAFGERGLSGRDDLPIATALSDVRCQVLMRHDFDPRAPLPSLVAQSYLPRLPDRPEAYVWVPQLGQADCGLAALAMVSVRRGKPVRVEELRAKQSVGGAGLSLQQLHDLAADCGLPSQAVRVSPHRLSQITLPAIAHLHSGHYIVLHELNQSGVVVADPAAGISLWSTDFLAKSASGAMLLFEPPQ